jgi:hemin uptake protein HemP
MMRTESPSQPSETRSYTPGTQRKRIRTTDLMQGGREVVLLHEGEEYILRITKTGKLILTK